MYSPPIDKDCCISDVRWKWTAQVISGRGWIQGSTEGHQLCCRGCCRKACNYCNAAWFQHCAAPSTGSRSGEAIRYQDPSTYWPQCYADRRVHAYSAQRVPAASEEKDIRTCFLLCESSVCPLGLMLSDTDANRMVLLQFKFTAAMYNAWSAMPSVNGCT